MPLKILTCLFFISALNLYSADNVIINVIGDRSNVNIIEDIVRKHLIDKSEIPMLRVDVKVTNHANGKSLTVILIGKEHYYFENVRIELSKQNDVLLIIRNVCPFEDNPVVLTCPDDELDMVFATPESSINSAVTSVKLACEESVKNGYSCKTLIGDEATALNYKRYLACKHLKVFGSIGYGNECSIKLNSTDIISNRWFDEVISNSIEDLIFFVNSSYVHNDPMKSSLMKLGVRTFIGGSGALKVADSEQVFICFMKNLSNSQKKIRNILEWCIDSKGSGSNKFEISGKGVYFHDLTPIPLEPIKIHPPMAQPKGRPWYKERFLE
jgi:hypothetical protein